MCYIAFGCWEKSMSFCHILVLLSTCLLCFLRQLWNVYLVLHIYICIGSLVTYKVIYRSLVLFRHLEMCISYHNSDYCGEPVLSRALLSVEAHVVPKVTGMHETICQTEDIRFLLKLIREHGKIALSIGDITMATSDKPTI